MATDPAYGRRQFITDSARSMAKAALEFSKEADAVRSPAPPPVRTDWLRPPGAVAESIFLERCTICGDCVKACPPGAITIHGQDGTPVLFADRSPCLLCEDLPCVSSCETGALEPVDSVAEVRMGTAVISYRHCTAGQGCHACVSKCPVHALAMDFESMQLAVTAETCVGCGICEMVCKTVNDHVAIRVKPARIL